MPLARRALLKLGLGTVATLATPVAGRTRGEPVIDVHLHAYPGSTRFPDPIVNPVTGTKSAIRTGSDHRTACLAEMERHHVVRGIVSGGDGDRLQAAVDWFDRDPARILVGAGVRGSVDTPLPPLDALRTLHAAGKLHVLGEVSAQYAGLTLSSPEFDPVLALAEELDLPVSLHSGTMPPGTTFDPCCRPARARFGHPEVVEEALNRHPKLRLNLMHCGWPYLAETQALLLLYPNVNVDTGAVGWLLPRPAFHAYLRTLVESGFGRRIMFGSDQMYWPDAIGLSIAAIETATFLTPVQKRDILHDNAVRFYRL